jgi:hypothetical protein
VKTAFSKTTLIFTAKYHSTDGSSVILFQSRLDVAIYEGEIKLVVVGDDCEQMKTKLLITHTMGILISRIY